MFDFKSKSAKFTGIDLTKWTQSKLVQMLLDTNIEKYLMIILVICIVIAIVLVISGGGNYLQGSKILEQLNALNQTMNVRRL
jgi:TRAP-type C4-dicarboxylate transport system permease small subunit